MKKSLAIGACVLLVLSCSKLDYFGPVYTSSSDSNTVSNHVRLIIGNEGNFQYANASISVVDLDSQAIAHEVFQKAMGQGIGDVLQSFYLKGDSLYVIMNNSALVRLLDAHTFFEIAQISDLVSPRYMGFLNDSVYVITDLYADKIGFYSIKSNALIAETDAPGWCERVLETDEKLIVACLEDNSLLEVDQQFQVTKVKQLDFIPQSLHSYNSGSIIVCGNSIESGSESSVLFLNTSYNEQMEIKLNEPFVGSALLGDSLYVLTKSRIEIVQVSNKAIVDGFSHGAQTPYGITVGLGSIFIADANDYLSKGKVIRFETDGKKQEIFEAGYIPQALLIDF